MYQKINTYPSAIDYYNKAIKLQTHITHLKISLLICKAFACDCSEPKYMQDTLKNIDSFGQDVCPFDLLSLEDNANNHLKRAKHFLKVNIKGFLKIHFYKLRSKYLLK